MKLYAVRYIEDKAMVGLFYANHASAWPISSFRLTLKPILANVNASRSRNAAPSCLVNPRKKGPTTCVGTNACIFAIGSIAPFVIVRLKPKAGHLSVLAKVPR